MTNSSTKKKPNGCLWGFAFFVTLILIGVLIGIFGNVSFFIALAIALVPAYLLTNLWVGKVSIPSTLKNGFLVVILVLAVRFGVHTLFMVLTEEVRTDHTFKPEEGIAITTLVEDNDTINVFSSHRVWKDNFGNKYQGYLTVRERDYLRLYDHISDFQPQNNSNHWGALYDYMEQKDGPSLDLVMETFKVIHNERKLNQMQFAEMVVSCIQDIPYSLVFQEECLPPEYYEDSVKRVLEECPDCCIGGITYGVQNPVSFLQNLKGDCDTRTVLIYTILKHFNYDVAILNSDFYKHSILGINLPAQGIYKPYYGKRYAVWETTAKYFAAGQLPANFSNIDYWKVILTSK